jgi:hypothetical protein
LNSLPLILTLILASDSAKHITGDGLSLHVQTTKQYHSK